MKSPHQLWAGFITDCGLKRKIFTTLALLHKSKIIFNNQLVVILTYFNKTYLNQ